MVFSAPIFLFLFLPLTLLLYTLLPQAGRNLLLTVASLLFYAWGELDFLPLLILSVILNYYFALWISDKRGTTLGKVILTLGIASDLLLLLYFKYIGFAVGTLNFALALVHVGPPLPMPSVSLPLGISFFTFHKISYKVDVYRGDAAAKRNPLDLALYILFFPQLIAGPIVRFNEVAVRTWDHPFHYWSGEKDPDCKRGRLTHRSHLLVARSGSLSRTFLDRHPLLCDSDLFRLLRLLRYGGGPGLYFRF
jgi:alginate O-acetyltransferase complex protein AlgI